jgi:hypothetical protein
VTWRKSVVVVTNVKDLTAKDAIDRYKALADIEPGVPGPERRARHCPHVPSPARPDSHVCSDLLHRPGAVPGFAAATAGPPTVISPARCLEPLRLIQHHGVHGPPQALTGVSTLAPQLGDLFAATSLPAPTRTRLESLVQWQNLNAAHVKTITQAVLFRTSELRFWRCPGMVGRDGGVRASIQGFSEAQHA